MKPFIAMLHTPAHMLITRQSTRLTKTTRTPTKGTRSRFFTRAKKLVQKEKIQPTTITEVLEQLEAIKAAVSKFPTFVPTLNKYLSEKCNTFTAARVVQFLPNGNK